MHDSCEAITLKPAARSTRLWRAILSLAKPVDPPEVAAGRPVVPGFAENLVVEFDDAYTTFVEGFDSLPSEGQMLVLQAVDNKLTSMVGAKDPELWTDQARRGDANWIEVRSLAMQVLLEFDWPANDG
jgi:hypothetical protein